MLTGINTDIPFRLFTVFRLAHSLHFAGILSPKKWIMSSFIPVADAALMNLKFRQNRNSILKPEYQNQNILPICETFEKSQIETILAKPGCTGLRVYYGADNDLKVHAVLVGVNSNNADILPGTITSLTNVEEDYVIERGVRCPEECPPESELNQP